MLTVLCMTCLVGILGFAVDVGVLLTGKIALQTAADAAAIAGAAELKYGDVSAKAQAAAAQNGVTDGANGATVTVSNPPTSGPHADDSSYVEVIAAQRKSTFFIKLFVPGTVTVSARAVAGNASSHGCLYALRPSGTGILANGADIISMPGCAIYDDSSDQTQAMLLNGAGRITAKWIGVVGKVLQNGGFTATPIPVSGVAPVSDPLAYLLAPTAHSCLPNPIINGSGTFTLNQGCYNGFTVNGSATVNLNPGTYYINGPLTFNGSGTITGTNVTFYLTGSSTFNGAQTLNLTAPTTGTYNGILFFQSRTDNQAATINGSNSSALKGIFYFPDASVTFNGSNSTELYTSVIAYSFTFNGSIRLNDYALINSATPLVAATLIE